MTSEWKCALEKALIVAAESPLPMEVFKVSCECHQSLSLSLPSLLPLSPPFFSQIQTKLLEGCGNGLAGNLLAMQV